MKMTFPLFIKSLRSMKAELTAILLFQFVLLLVRFNDIITLDMRAVFGLQMKDDLFTMTFFLYPALLLYNLYMDREIGTVIQWHSTPLKRWRDMTSRLFAVFTALAASTLMTFIIYMLKNIFAPDTIKVSLPIYISAKLLYWTCDPLFLSCMVCFGWGLVQIPRSNRLLLGLTTVSILFGFYKWSAWFHSGLSLSSFNLGRKFYSISSKMMWTHLSVTMVIGGLCAAIGMLLYEKYGEV